MKPINLLISLCIFTQITTATDYHVGPGQALTTISEVPWTTLQAGDKVYIHWRNTPYKEKWVINRQGTASNPIEIIGISNAQGEKPIIDGNNALTVANVNYWNENRGVIKIGGSNVPADGLPAYIIIDNLEVKSAHPDYQFTNDNGQVESYTNNAAAIYIEKGANITIRNCILQDSGNGLFIGAHNGDTQNIIIQNNHIYNNGIVGSYYEHNTYTAAINITYLFNRLGPMRSGALGNNLKDRSAGLVIKYNWIEDGNRQLDLVDSYDVSEVANDPAYSKTYVYGNILIEPNGAGNSQILHYGGDSGTTSVYRKGDLYFYNNTIISTRNGNTTLMRLSTNDETAHVFNNVIYTTASGSNFAMIDDTGIFNMNNNWLKTGWQNCFCSPNGTINDLGNNITGTDPMFEDFSTQEFRPIENSPLLNQGASIPSVLLPEHDVIFEYVKHQNSINRPLSGNLDIGAYELDEDLDVDQFEIDNFSIYPNPVKNIIFFNNKSGEIIDASIHTITGRKILEISGDTTKIDTSMLSTGVYFLRINFGSAIKYVRFVKN